MKWLYDSTSLSEQICLPIYFFCDFGSEQSVMSDLNSLVASRVSSLSLSTNLAPRTLSFDSVVVSGPSSAAVIGWVGANVGPLRSSDPRPLAYSVAYWALRLPNFVT